MSGTNLRGYTGLTLSHVAVHAAWHYFNPPRLTTSHATRQAHRKIACVQAITTLAFLAITMIPTFSKALKTRSISITALPISLYSLLGFFISGFYFNFAITGLALEILNTRDNSLKGIEAAYQKQIKECKGNRTRRKKVDQAYELYKTLLN